MCREGLGLEAFRAQEGEKPLMQDKLAYSTETFGILSQICKSSPYAGIIACVERAQDAVPCPGRLHGNGCSFLIPDFTDQDTVRCLPQKCADRLCPRQSGRGIK